jgi:hypothetical protein
MATKSPYHYYNEVLSKWPTAIAASSQWFVQFDFSGANVLKNNFNRINQLDSADVQSNKLYWYFPKQTTETLLNNKNQSPTDVFLGCVFARDITIPSETVKASNEGLDYGGYQAPAVASEREKYNKLKITFNESNSSFLDFIIRPWIVNVGYFGLVARDINSEKAVKANLVQACYLGKTGGDRSASPIIRKVINFFNVAPVGLQSMTSQYQSEGLQYASVDFVYDHYTVTDPTDGSMLTK